MGAVLRSFVIVFVGLFPIGNFMKISDVFLRYELIATSSARSRASGNKQVVTH